jgi:hypothetical protein
VPALRHAPAQTASSDSQIHALQDRCINLGNAFARFPLGRLFFAAASILNDSRFGWVWPQKD